MQNIKNNSTRRFNVRLYNDEYFDFMLYRGEVEGIDYNINDNLIADFSTFDIHDGILYSTAKWNEAVNDGVLMEDIGFTGIDNGLIQFEKDKISNKDFLKILTGSTYEIESGDTRLFLTPVTGNTKNFEYPMFFNNEDEKYISFKGGFYQGFYKLFGFDYQVLPNGIDFEWNLQFNIRPRTDYEDDVKSLNHIHPENKGIFFYIGTRAENKFINLYGIDSATAEEYKIESVENDSYFNPNTCEKSGETITLVNNIVHEKDYTLDVVEEPEPEPELEPEYFDDDYFDDDYFEDNQHIDYGKCKENKKCSQKSNSTWHISDLYTYKYDETSVNCCCDKSCKEPCPKPKCDCKNYFDDDYFKVPECGKGKKYADEEYFGEDVDIDENLIKDSFEHLITKKGYYEIESDNKFLMFDRTKYGLTTKDWVEETKVILTGRNDWGNLNYFPIMNRTKTGYTVNNIYEYQEENIIPYNIYKDIKNNCFALKVTENGAIGYKYGILDCNSENEKHYTMEEEYSKDGIIKNNEWNNIVVKFIILNPKVVYKKDGTLCPDPNKGKRKMKILFFVNGNLVFVSKELNEFNFRELNDNFEKQEAVPYNISLGGGTQGLLESILPDYYKEMQYAFPIEKDFCGTFMGDISSFKIYNSYINYSTIKNYLSKNNDLIKN